MVLLSNQRVWESEQQTSLVEMAVQRHKGDLQGDCPQCPSYLYPLQTLLGQSVLGASLGTFKKKKKKTGVQLPLLEIPIQ